MVIGLTRVANGALLPRLAAPGVATVFAADTCCCCCCPVLDAALTEVSDRDDTGLAGCCGCLLFGKIKFHINSESID